MDTSSIHPGRHVHPTNAFIPIRLEDINQAITARFESQVALHANKLAVTCDSFRWTYGELNQMAGAVASAILNSVEDAEEPVIVLLDQATPAIAAILGVLKAGKIYVPLDPLYPKQRLEFMARHCGARLVVTNSRHVDLCTSLALDNVRIINIDDLSQSDSGNSRVCDIDPGRAAHIIYTSGSTGRPRGVLQNHRNLLFEVSRVTNSFHVSKEDRLALLHSISTIASVRRIFPALAAFTSIGNGDISPRRFDVFRLAERCRR